MELAVPDARTDLLSGTQSQGLPVLVRAEKATAKSPSTYSGSSGKGNTLVLDFFLISAGRSAEFWNEWSEQVISSDLQVLTIYVQGF